MPAVELPNGQSAILYARSEISERTARNIARAFMVSSASAAKLVKAGYDEADPTTWDAFTSLSLEEQESLKGYELALIVGMVREWTLGDKTPEAILDLNELTYAKVLEACAAEFTKTEEFGPDGVNDPKAPTADSLN